MRVARTCSYYIDSRSPCFFFFFCTPRTVYSALKNPKTNYAIFFPPSNRTRRARTVNTLLPVIIYVPYYTYSAIISNIILQILARVRYVIILLCTPRVYEAHVVSKQFTLSIRIQSHASSPYRSRDCRRTVKTFS